jgi:hypothetical protein
MRSGRSSVLIRPLPEEHPACSDIRTSFAAHKVSQCRGALLVTW